MKALPIAVSMLIVAVPLFASAAKDQPKKKAPAAASATAAPADSHDSPLVRAAKATGRLGKKPTNVITNETLAKSGGHLTTTKYITPLPAIKEPEKNDAAEAKALAAKKQQQEAEEKAREEEAAKKAKIARRAAADYYGEDAETRIDDPAAQEHAIQQSTSTTAPQQSQKPPQN